MSKLLVVVALLSSGCSIAFQSKPAKPGLARTECSTSSVPWIVDAAIASTAALAVTAYTVATTERSDLGMGAAGVGLLGAVFFAASAGNGKRWRDECEAVDPAHVATAAGRSSAALSAGPARRTGSAFDFAK